MKINFKPIIGIMGGTGHDATIDLQIKLSMIMKKKLCINHDQDYYRIITDNNSHIPDRQNAILNNGDSPLNFYLDSLNKLKFYGANIILIPCNTAHVYFDDIQRQSTLPIINMIEETAKFIHLSENADKVGLLGTEATIKSKLYDNYLSKYGIEVITPQTETQKKVVQAIYAIKAGYLPDLGILSNAFLYEKHYLKSKDKYIIADTISPKDVFMHAIDELCDKGLKHIILGCTEIPLVIMAGSYKKCKLFDPTIVLARRAIDLATELIIESSNQQVVA